MPDDNDVTRRFGSAMVAAFWILLLVMLTWLFSGWLEQQFNPNGTATGSVAPDGTREVRLARNRHGHYVATGTINGAPATFLVDTGASDVSIPSKLAERVGLRRGTEAVYGTANGPVTMYRTVIDRLALGNIALTDVRASINPAMADDDTVLLGMSFLRQLEFVQREGTLILRRGTPSNAR